MRLRHKEHKFLAWTPTWGSKCWLIRNLCAVPQHVPRSDCLPSVCGSRGPCLVATGRWLRLEHGFPSLEDAARNHWATQSNSYNPVQGQGSDSCTSASQLHLLLAVALENVTDLSEPMVSSFVKEGKYILLAAERIQVQACLVDTAGSVSNCRREVNRHLFTGGQSRRLQFVKNTTSVKDKTARLHEMRCACG